MSCTRRRISGRAGAWEVWNEANLPNYWGGAPDRARYVDYLRTAYPVLHQYSDAPVLSGASVPNEVDTNGLNAADWTRYFYEVGANRYFDAVAYHPYMWFQSFHTGAVDPEGGYLTRPGDEIRRIMVEHGDGGKKIWATEVGYTTAGQFSYSEADQASYLTAQIADLRSRDYAGPTFVYTLQDLPLGDREGHFGLLRGDHSPKPAWDALRRAAGCP